MANIYKKYRVAGFALILRLHLPRHAHLLALERDQCRDGWVGAQEVGVETAHSDLLLLFCLDWPTLSKLGTTKMRAP